MSAEISSVRMEHKAHCFLTCGKKIGVEKKKKKKMEAGGVDRQREEGRANG